MFFKFHFCPSDFSLPSFLFRSLQSNLLCLLPSLSKLKRSSSSLYSTHSDESRRPNQISITLIRSYSFVNFFLSRIPFKQCLAWKKILENWLNSDFSISRSFSNVQEMQLVPSDDDRKEHILFDESTSSNEIVAAERGDRVVEEEGEVSEIAESDDETTHLVAGDQPQCRICLDVGGEDLIGPCNCKGTQKYVHRSCLDNWRSTKEGFAFSHCTECRAVFKLRANVPPDRWWLRLRFQLLVARDHAFIFITVQMVVAFLGLLVYKFYGEELREMFGYEEHPYGFYTLAVLAIVLVGLLYGFFIAIICGQRINERHYHVLAKQELTKEYIVEDQECKNVPDLDQSHVMELRMLGLY